MPPPVSCCAALFFLSLLLFSGFFYLFLHIAMRQLLSFCGTHHRVSRTKRLAPTPLTFAARYVFCTPSIRLSSIHLIFLQFGLLTMQPGRSRVNTAFVFSLLIFSGTSCRPRRRLRPEHRQELHGASRWIRGSECRRQVYTSHCQDVSR